MKRKVLSLRGQQRGLNLPLYAVVWLLLDRFNPAGWIWGVVGTICVLNMIISVLAWWGSDVVEMDDLLEER